MKFFHILCVAYYKFNGVHHYFIMNVKEVLNRFSHVYVINVTMTTCVTTFWHTLSCFHPSMANGGARFTISNPKTLTSAMTHQEVWDVVAPTWHDVNYEQLFLKKKSKLHALQ